MSWFKFFQIFTQCFDGTITPYDWQFKRSNTFQVKHYKQVARRVPVDFTELSTTDSQNRKFEVINK